MSNRISVPSKIVEEDGTVIYIKIVKELVLSKEIKTLVIEEGIEEIEGNFFEDSRKLREVTLHDSLKKIGNYAFANSKILETIILPKGLKEIGEGALERYRMSNFSRILRYLFLAIQ